MPGPSKHRRTDDLREESPVIGPLGKGKKRAREESPQDGFQDDESPPAKKNCNESKLSGRRPGHAQSPEYYATGVVYRSASGTVEFRSGVEEDEGEDGGEDSEDGDGKEGEDGDGDEEDEDKDKDKDKDEESKEESSSELDEDDLEYEEDEDRLSQSPGNYQSAFLGWCVLLSHFIHTSSIEIVM